MQSDEWRAKLLITCIVDYAGKPALANVGTSACSLTLWQIKSNQIYLP